MAVYFVAIKSVYFNRHTHPHSNPSSTINGTPNFSHSSINNEYINKPDIFYEILNNMNSSIVQLHIGCHLRWMSITLCFTPIHPIIRFYSILFYNCSSCAHDALFHSSGFVLISIGIHSTCDVIVEKKKIKKKNWHISVWIACPSIDSRLQQFILKLKMIETKQQNVINVAMVAFFAWYCVMLFSFALLNYDVNATTTTNGYNRIMTATEVFLITKKKMKRKK